MLQCGSGRWRAGDGVEGGQGTGVPGGDHVFDRGAGAGGVQDRAYAGGAVVVQVFGADQGVEELSLGGVRSLGGQGEQDGVLALAQVVQDGLAGVVGSAVDAEEVVAQLKGLPERECVARQGGVQVRSASARVAPQCRGRSTVYFAVLKRITCRAASWSVIGPSGVMRSKYWP